MPSDPDSGRRFSRREALAATGALGLGGALYVLLRGGGGDATAARTAAAVPTATPAATSGASCILTPEQTEGPYYIDNHLIRRDIREHHKGAPLELRLTVEDATTCKPLAGATVEVWHCDATGAYSGFGAQGGSSGRTFLRGGQRTGADGVATFKTIYPGWY